MTSDPQPRLLDALARAPLRLAGRLRAASNGTWYGRVDLGDVAVGCVYKPVAGERALWDFPDGTITHREMAAYEVSQAAGWGVVPPTAWRVDGPAGEGMCQAWIDAVPASCPIDVVRPGAVPPGWRRVLAAEDGAGDPVVLVHADDLALQRVAVFDAVVNNADRKGGHVLADERGRYWAIDHGVAFAPEDKLRTVLWGWVGQVIPAQIRADLAALDERLGAHYDPVDRWLDDGERAALRRRLRVLLEAGVFPAPAERWPAIPWPVF